MHVFKPTFLAFPLLPLLATAHFELISPAARGFDEDKLATYPCGGQDTVSDDRTPFPLAGGPIQLNMGHDHAEVQVNIALGRDAVDGNAFSTTVLPITQEEGLGDFCIGGVVCSTCARLESSGC